MVQSKQFVPVRGLMGQTILGWVSALGVAGMASCNLTTNASSFFIAKSQGPEFAYTADTFSTAPGFGFFKVSDSSSYKLVEDTITVSAFSDSACTSAISSGFSISSSSAALVEGNALFSGVKYVWPVSGYEGTIYLKGSATRSGISVCAAFPIVQKFGGGRCANSGCTGPGNSTDPGTGATLDDRGTRVVRDSQGRLMVFGNSRPNAKAANFFAHSWWRFLPNGTFDTKLAGNGTTALYGGTGGNFQDRMWDVAQDANSKFIIVGDSFNNTPVGRTYLRRYNADGTADTTFSGGNSHYIAPTNLAGGTHDQGRGIAIDSSGFAWVGGFSTNASGGTELALWKFDVSGGAPSVSASHSWGSGAAGWATAATLVDQYTAVAIDSSGRPVAAGRGKNASGGFYSLVSRYTTSAVPDSTFGSGGVAVYSSSIGGLAAASSNDVSFGLAIDSSGRIVVGGRAQYSGGYYAYVIRYTSAGALDSSFGTGGIRVITVGAAGGTQDFPQQLKIDSSGRIVMVGYSGDGTYWRPAAWRLTSSGALDTTFNGTGYMSILPTVASVSNTHGYGYGFIFDQVGRIVISGQASSGTGFGDLAIWRVLSTGVLEQ